MKLYNENDIQDIANAIRDKNGSNSLYKVNEMAQAIEDIPSGGDISDYFSNEIIGRSSAGSPSLGTVWSASIKKMPAIANGENDSFISMYQNFKGTNIDCSLLNVSKATSLRTMFLGDENLISLDLSNFYGANIVSCEQTFFNCKSLIHLDMRNFDFTLLTNISNMFGSNASSGPPNNCEIIVKDNTQKQWFSTNFSRFINVKTVAEYEG